MMWSYMMCGHSAVTTPTAPVNRQALPARPIHPHTRGCQPVSDWMAMSTLMTAPGRRNHVAIERSEAWRTLELSMAKPGSADS